jgi:hypothetical protein
MIFANLPGAEFPYPVRQCPPGDARTGDGTARPIGFTKAELAYLIFRVKFWTFTSSLAWGTYTPYGESEQRNFSPWDWWDEHSGDARFTSVGGWQGSWLLPAGKLPNGNLWALNQDFTADPSGLPEGAPNPNFARFFHPTDPTIVAEPITTPVPFFDTQQKYASLTTGRGTGFFAYEYAPRAWLSLNLGFSLNTGSGSDCVVLFDGALYWPNLLLYVGEAGLASAASTNQSLGGFFGALSDPVGTLAILGKTTGIYGHPASGTYVTDSMGSTADIPPALTGDFAWVADSEW